MIIVRAPFRISLGGGGTDLPSFYHKYGGELISVAINKYIYININRPIIDDLIRLKYSQSEKVKTVDEIKHDLIREALRLTGVSQQIEISSMADLPAGTGMGSSGSFLVALLRGLHTLKKEAVYTQDLAEEACKIEIEILKKPVGKQDQYLAAFGGVTKLKIAKNGEVEVNKMNIDPAKLREIENSLIIFYTGVQRSSNEILKGQSQRTKKNHQKTVENLLKIKEIGQKVSQAIKAGDVNQLGTLMDFHWQIKKQLSGKISSDRFDELYEQARLAGALGGKIVGAGGGGFLVFCCPGDKTKLRQVLVNAGLREMMLNFDLEGAKVIADIR